MRLLNTLKAFFWRRSRTGTGGIISPRRTEAADSIPAMLSPSRYALKRPGETDVDVLNRLMEGRDIYDEVWRP